MHWQERKYCNKNGNYCFFHVCIILWSANFIPSSREIFGRAAIVLSATSVATLVLYPRLHIALIRSESNQVALLLSGCLCNCNYSLFSYTAHRKSSIIIGSVMLLGMGKLMFDGKLKDWVLIQCLTPLGKTDGNWL